MQQVELGALPKVRAIVDLSKSEIFRRIKADTFPKPVRLGSRCTRWNLQEVREWAAARLAEREG
jgi:prophage regulatory protein